jgi:hypothetical protein
MTLEEKQALERQSSEQAVFVTLEKRFKRPKDKALSESFAWLSREEIQSDERQSLERVLLVTLEKRSKRSKGNVWSESFARL